MIKCIRDTIAVIRENEEEVLKSGIIIPNVQGVNDSVFVGTVVGAGEGILLSSGVSHPLAVKVGDRIAVDIKQAKVIRDGRETIYVLRESGVVCIFPPEPFLSLVPNA
jgi:co-chaperonin GroES (HSP10)